MTLNSIMNLICRFICIAYVTVRSYDTSFFNVTFFLLLLMSLNSSEMYVASGIVRLVKKLTQFCYKAKIVGSSLQSYVVFIAIKHLQYNHVHF